MENERRWLAPVVLALFAGLPPRGAAQVPAAKAQPTDTEHEARLTSVSGTVYLHLRDHAQGEFTPAEADATLESGDMIRTGEDGKAEFTLDGQSMIEVSANTDFTVTSLASEHTEFHVGIGSIVAKLKHLLEGQNMEFHTPTAVAAVRGTELGVSQEGDDKQAHIGVFDEGQVAVTRPDGKGEARLGPGQELEVNKGKPLGAPRALTHFAASRQRLDAVRGRLGTVSKNWVRRSPQARQASRVQLKAKPVVRAGQLKGVKKQLQNRKYPQLQKRQNVLQQNHQKRLQGANRRPHIRPRQQQQRQQQRQQQQRQQQRQPQQQQRQPPAQQQNRRPQRRK